VIGFEWWQRHQQPIQVRSRGEGRMQKNRRATGSEPANSPSSKQAHLPPIAPAPRHLLPMIHDRFDRLRQRNNRCWRRNGRFIRLQLGRFRHGFRFHLLNRPSNPNPCRYRPLGPGRFPRHSFRHRFNRDRSPRSLDLLRLFGDWLSVFRCLLRETQLEPVPQVSHLTAVFLNCANYVPAAPRCPLSAISPASRQSSPASVYQPLERP
jgi:hypothetical protein